MERVDANLNDSRPSELSIVVSSKVGWIIDEIQNETQHLHTDRGPRAATGTGIIMTWTIM